MVCGRAGLLGDAVGRIIERAGQSSQLTSNAIPPDNENRPGHVGLGDALAIVQYQMAQDERDERYG